MFALLGAVMEQFPNETKVTPTTIKNDMRQKMSNAVKQIKRRSTQVPKNSKPTSAPTRLYSPDRDVASSAEN